MMDFLLITFVFLSSVLRKDWILSLFTSGLDFLSHHKHLPLSLLFPQRPTEEHWTGLRPRPVCVYLVSSAKCSSWTRSLLSPLSLWQLWVILCRCQMWHVGAPGSLILVSFAETNWIVLRVFVSEKLADLEKKQAPLNNGAACYKNPGTFT